MLQFFTYIFYGITFFALGIVITAKDLKISKLALARILWILAVFGFTHGVYEWTELYVIIDGGAPLWFSRLRHILLFASFVALYFFGLELVFISLVKKYKKDLPVIYSRTAFVLLSALLVFIWLSGADERYVRLFVAFPGALLSGTGLIIYSTTVRGMSLEGSYNFVYSGAFMVLYAIVSGIIPHEDVPDIIILRGLCAVGVTFFIYRGMNVFDHEKLMIIEERLNRFAMSEKLNSIGKLAAGIAHEINNPLTNVLLKTEMLKSMIENPEALSKLEGIERNADRASKIAKELLYFSREGNESKSVIDINDVITSAVSLMGQHKLLCRTVLASQPIYIRGVYWKLEEVIINLILNAADACGMKGAIDIASFVYDESAAVRVTDKGCGIPPENLTKIFDPFFTTKEPGEGTGLGLSICYNIVEQHGGSISVISSPGNGTEITVLLPMEASDEQQNTVDGR
ncbi:MAG: sensor histidine kinase [Deferribacterales bacterium]